jgi:hypothetical protein
MTKKKVIGSPAPTPGYQVSGKVYDVVTTLNNKLANVNKRAGVWNGANAITPEEMMWIENFIRTGSIKQASWAAYGKNINNDQHARNKGLLKLQKPMIQRALHEVLSEGDFQDDKLLTKLSEVIYGSPNSSDILKGLDMAFKLKGAYAPERHIQASVTRDLSALGYEDFEKETLDLLEEDSGSSEEDILDGIALRDGEETRS